MSRSKSRSGYHRRRLHEQVVFQEDKRAMLDRYRYKLLQRKVQQVVDEVGAVVVWL